MSECLPPAMAEIKRQDKEIARLQSEVERLRGRCGGAVAFGVFYKGVLQEYAFSESAATALAKEDYQGLEEITVRPVFTHPPANTSEAREIVDRVVAKLEAKSDACKQQAKIWKQEARTQSAIVAEIYQELTGKTGEPGDWNGARPLKPAILRKQAEAIEALASARFVYGTKERLAAMNYAQRLRQQAAESESGAITRKTD